MGLRSHDRGTAGRGTERFGDAMRVLSRRPTGNERTTLVPRRPAGPRAVVSGGPVPPPSFMDRAEEIQPAPPLSLAARRRRVMLGLSGVALLCLVAGLAGATLLGRLGLVLLLAAVAFVVHCRRQAVLKAGRRRAQATRHEVEGRRAAAPRIPGIPLRMPVRPAPLTAPLPAPGVRYDEPVPARGASGADWEPVPVPLPTYVGKEVAPARPRRVLDLTRPGEWTAGLDLTDAVLEDVADGKDLDVILERRRAVGGW